MATRPVLALLHHAAHRNSGYFHLVNLMAPHWREAGFGVVTVYGAERFVPADVAFLHVDLSVVPESYREFARRYPRVINGNITDIRKRGYSLNMIQPGDDYAGPVIVKTSLNSAGIPESYARRAAWRNSLVYRAYRRFFARQPFGMREKSDYKIYPSLRQVPHDMRRSEEVVVEKFLPEKDGDQFCLREWYFLGRAEFTTCEVSGEPVFTCGVEAPEKAAPPPPEIRAIRERLGLDYGKIDYALHQGEPVLFDVNKTTGVVSASNPRTLVIAKILSEGIYSYFPELRPARANSRMGTA